jgi:hypothetical protein
MRRRILDLPTPDQKPKHKVQLSEPRDSDEAKMDVQIKVSLQPIDRLAQSMSYVLVLLAVRGNIMHNFAGAISRRRGRIACAHGCELQ